MMERYLYRPRLVPMLLAGTLFAGCAAFFIYRARDNEQGLIINHVIELGVAGATIFYAVFATFSVAFVMASLAGLVQRAGEPRYLVLDEHAVTVPKRWSKAVVSVRYADIRELNWQSVSGQDTLLIKADGAKVAIAAIMLESKDVFEQVANKIRDKVEGDQDEDENEDEDENVDVHARAHGGGKRGDEGGLEG